MSEYMVQERIISEILDRMDNAVNMLQDAKELEEPHGHGAEVRGWIAEYSAKLEGWKEALDEVMDGSETSPKDLRKQFSRTSMLYHFLAEEQRNDNGRDTVFIRLNTKERLFSTAGEIVEEEAGLESLDETELNRIENSVRRSRGKPLIEIDPEAGSGGGSQ